MDARTALRWFANRHSLVDMEFERPIGKTLRSRIGIPPVQIRILLAEVEFVTFPAGFRWQSP